jgi:hypothetical protein
MRADMVDRDNLRGPDNGILSLDFFFRGFIMFMLIVEATEVYDLLVAPKLKGLVLYSIGLLRHHLWKGLHVLDLGQPLLDLLDHDGRILFRRFLWPPRET